MLSTNFLRMTLVLTNNDRTQKYDVNPRNIIFKDNTLQKVSTYIYIKDKQTNKDKTTTNRSIVIQSLLHHKLTIVTLKYTISPFNLYTTN